MKSILFCPLSATLLYAWLVTTSFSSLSAQAVISTLDEGHADGERRNQWVYTNQSGYQLAQRQLKLIPQAEPRPALSVTLIPNEFELLDGNAAVQYLQALAFAEQQYALERMREFSRESRQAVEAAGLDFSQAEPYVWLETSPRDLPLERVRKYLDYSSFQSRYLEQAVLRRHCDFDRNMRAVANPIGYLLPEIQALRELARLQSMRYRLAIAEDRPHDALSIFGQQLALGHHLDEEQFLVSNLVGIAIASMGVDDAYFLSEQANTPNLYWALAALPQPLVSMRAALAYEREFLFEQFKQLREVDDTPQPAIYWRRFVEAQAENLKNSDSFGDLPPAAYSPEGLTLIIATAYPGAKLFLVEETGMDVASVEALPVTQTVMLAIRRVHEQMRDEVFKVNYVPQHLRGKFAPDPTLGDMQDKYGWVTTLSSNYLPGIEAATAASARLQQQLALLQTVEAIRDYLSRHDGQLPGALSDLQLPAPHDPLTQQPFAYRVEQARATLSAATAGHIKYELELLTQPE